MSANALGDDAIMPKVLALEEGLTLSTGPPNIEAASLAVELNRWIGSSGINFDDVEAFGTDLTSEAADMAAMMRTVEEGKQFISMIYTYRCCSKALPMVTASTPEEQKKTLHMRVFDVLTPEMAKLQSFMEFYERAVQLFVRNLRKLVQPAQSNAVCSEDHIRALEHMIDMLVIMDALKDMKACLQNDFARYKRSFANVRNDLEDSDIIADSVHNLQMFLGNPQQPNDLIMSNLRAEVQKVPGFEDALALLIEDCMDSLSKEVYLLAKEKHMLYRVLINLVFLLDGEGKKATNVFRYKKVNIDRVRQTFRYLPVIPLYGDMQLSIEFVLRRCPNFDSAKMAKDWLRGFDDAASYLLIHKRDQIREEYNSFMGQFLQVLNEVKARVQGHDDSEMIRATGHAAFDRVKEGFHLMSQWNAAIKEQLAFKRSHPISQEEYLARGGSAEEGGEFERVDRFNYSDTELHALGDVLGMLKGVGSIMRDANVYLAPVLRRSMHDDVQEYLQTVLARPLRKAYKRKRGVHEVMTTMRRIAADWGEGSDQTDDYKNRKSVLKVMSRQFPKRSVPPSSTQLFLLRRMTLTVFSKKSKGMQGGLFSDKDLKADWVADFERFYTRTFFYKYILDYENTLKTCVDMSDLWFREFYLEMTKCVQFPISMSLPFLLSEFVITTPHMADNLFFPVDIYNDAADRAICELKQQFLYDEIEAEVNLSFDSMVYNLAMKVFTCFKSLASSMLLDTKYRRKLESIRTNRSYAPVSARYITLLEQRDVRLLGRSIDFRRLLAQHINGYFRQNIDMAISRFESSDLPSIIDLQSILSQIKLTHRLIAEYLTIDSFEGMYAEVNEDTSFAPFRGRVIVHVFSELVADVLPSFCYSSTTQRYVRGPVQFVDPPPRDSMPKFHSQYWYTTRFNKPFNDVLKLTRGFFGQEHILAILEVLDSTDIGMIFEMLCGVVEEKINCVFASYANVIIDSLDPIKLPSLKYGVIGGYGYFDLKLKPIASYDNIRSDVFQVLREIGNAISFIHLLERVMSQERLLDFNMSAFFGGIRPSGVSGALKGPQDNRYPFASIMRSAVSQASSCIVQDMSRCIDQTNQIFSSVVQPPDGSLLAALIQRILSSITSGGAKKEWMGPPPANGVIDAETPRDFCRLWSALQFVFCQQSPEQLAGNEESDLATFGDGWAWAGITLMSLLGFRKRFEALDFVYYVLRMQQIMPKDLSGVSSKKKKSKLTPEQQLFPYVKGLLKTGGRIWRLNSYIFSILESHCPIDDNEKPIQRFHPPPSFAPENSVSFGSWNHSQNSSFSVPKQSSSSVAPSFSVVPPPVPPPVPLDGNVPAAPPVPLPLESQPSVPPPPPAPTVGSVPPPPALPGTDSMPLPPPPSSASIPPPPPAPAVHAAPPQAPVIAPPAVSHHSSTTPAPPPPPLSARVPPPPGPSKSDVPPVRATASAAPVHPPPPPAAPPAAPPVHPAPPAPPSSSSGGRADLLAAIRAKGGTSGLNRSLGTQSKPLSAAPVPAKKPMTMMEQIQANAKARQKTTAAHAHPPPPSARAHPPPPPSARAHPPPPPSAAPAHPPPPPPAAPPVAPPVRTAPPAAPSASSGGRADLLAAIRAKGGTCGLKQSSRTQSKPPSIAPVPARKPMTMMEQIQANVKSRHQRQGSSGRSRRGSRNSSADSSLPTPPRLPGQPPQAPASIRTRHPAPPRAPERATHARGASGSARHPPPPAAPHMPPMPARHMPAAVPPPPQQPCSVPPPPPPMMSRAPPPPPMMNRAPPPPPPPMACQTPATSASSQCVPPPPPPAASRGAPPPPPPPAASRGAPPPPPPPPAPVPAAPPAATSRARPPAAAGSDRSALLAAIRNGTALKKVAGEPAAPKKPAAPKRMNMMDEMAAAMARRRKH